MIEYRELARSLRHCAEYDCTTECPRFGIGEGCIRTMKHAAANAIEKLEAAAPKWIRTAEQEPEPDPCVGVLCYDTRTGGYRIEYGEYGYPDYWMPLPAPPKEVE